MVVEEESEWMYIVYLKGKFMTGLGDQVYLVGKEGSRMAPKYLAYAAGGMLLFT